MKHETTVTVEDHVITFTVQTSRKPPVGITSIRSAMEEGVEEVASIIQDVYRQFIVTETQFK